jgi:hypothetical protein
MLIFSAILFVASLFGRDSEAMRIGVGLLAAEIRALVATHLILRLIVGGIDGFNSANKSA